MDLGIYSKLFDFPNFFIKKTWFSTKASSDILSSTMSKKQSTAAIEEAPGLGDIESLFPPTSASDSVRLAANVSMKLPVFWPDAAEVWFAQADAQFAIRNVTVSKKKFYNSVAVLPQEVALQILDLIRAPPAGDPYGVLRERPSRSTC